MIIYFLLLQFYNFLSILPLFFFVTFFVSMRSNFHPHWFVSLLFQPVESVGWEDLSPPSTPSPMADGWGLFRDDDQGASVWRASSPEDTNPWCPPWTKDDVDSRSNPGLVRIHRGNTPTDWSTADQVESDRERECLEGLSRFGPFRLIDRREGQKSRNWRTWKKKEIKLNKKKNQL